MLKGLVAVTLKVHEYPKLFVDVHDSHMYSSLKH